MVGVERYELQLAPDESLLWAGQPTRAALVFGDRDLFRVPLSLLFCGIVLYLAVRGWVSGASTAVLPMAPLLVAVMYFAVGRFLLNWYLRLRTGYFLTTKRVAISRRSFGRTRSVERAIGDVTLIERDVAPDGSGTVRFDPDPGRFGVFPRSRLSDWHDAGLDGLQFFRIPDAAAVIGLIETSTSFHPEAGSPQDS